MCADSSAAAMESLRGIQDFKLHVSLCDSCRQFHGSNVVTVLGSDLVIFNVGR